MACLNDDADGGNPTMILIYARYRRDKDDHSLQVCSKGYDLSFNQLLLLLLAERRARDRKQGLRANE